MNVLMVLATKFPPQCRSEKEAASLIKLGHTVHLLTINRGNEKAFEIFNGIHVHRLDLEPKGAKKLFWDSLEKIMPLLKTKRHVLKTHQPLRDLISTLNSSIYLNIDNILNNVWLTEIEKIIKKENIDFLHIHDIPSIRVANILKRKYKLPLLLDMHENWAATMEAHASYKGIKSLIPKTLKFIYQQVEKKACECSDEIIVVVDESKERLLKNGVPASKITTIYNSVDTEHFDTFEDNPSIKELPKGYRIVYSGTFGKHRGLELAISSMPLVVKKNPDAHLILVGDGPNRKELEILVDKLGIRNHVHFIGFVHYSHLPAYIKKCDVCLVLHTNSDHTHTTVPHKLFEYMYQEKPIIVTKARPLKRIVEEEDCGLVVGWTPDSVAEAIHKLADPKLRMRLAKNSKHAAITKYAWNVIEKDFVKVYERMN